MDAMFDPVTFNGAAFGITTKRGAIGVQSTEKQPNHSVAWGALNYDHWGFIKVNGDRPSEVDTAKVDNIVTDGAYDFFYENAVMWNNACVNECLTAMQFIAQNAGTDETLFDAFGTPVGAFAINGVGPAGNVNGWNNAGNVFPVSRATHELNSCKGLVLAN